LRRGKRVAYFVTLGFNESKALNAVARAGSEGGDVVLIVRVDPIDAAEKAVARVREFAKPLKVSVKVMEVNPKDWVEVIRIAQAMKAYDEVHVIIGGGLRIPQAFTILAALDAWDRVRRLEVHDHDTGDEVVIPKWLVPLIASPERKGKVRVLLALSAEEPRTRGDIAARVGLSEQTVAKYLSYLVKAGLAKRVMPNKYRLTPEGERVKTAYASGQAPPKET